MEGARFQGAACVLAAGTQLSSTCPVRLAFLVDGADFAHQRKFHQLARNAAFVPGARPLRARSAARPGARPPGRRGGGFVGGRRGAPRRDCSAAREWPAANGRRRTSPCLQSGAIADAP